MRAGSCRCCRDKSYCDEKLGHLAGLRLIECCLCLGSIPRSRDGFASPKARSHDDLIRKEGASGGCGMDFRVRQERGSRHPVLMLPLLIPSAKSAMMNFAAVKHRDVINLSCCAVMSNVSSTTPRYDTKRSMPAPQCTQGSSAYELLHSHI